MTQTEQSAIINKWHFDLIKGGYKRGWFGSTELPEELVYLNNVVNGKAHITAYQLLAIIVDDYATLKTHCAWKEEELNSLLALFNFSSIEQVKKIFGGESVREMEKVFLNNKYIGDHAAN